MTERPLMFHVVVDSAADLPAALAQELAIHVVPILVELDGNSVLDGAELTGDALYARLTSGSPPRAAAPAPGAFAHLFTRLADDGIPVLSLSSAGALRAAYAAAKLGAQLSSGAHVVCLDSAMISLPVSFLAAHAARAARSDQPIETVAAELERLRERTVLYIGLAAPAYARSGQLKRSSTLRSNPIVQASHGALTAVTQVRSQQQIGPKLVTLAAAHGRYTALGVLYTTNRAAAEQLADRCAAAGLLERTRIVVQQIGAGLGLQVGPGALGVAGILG